MSKFKLSKPSPGGDKWDKSTHIDHLHLFISDDFTAEKVDTAYGEAEAIKVDHVVCVDDRELWADMLIFGAALVPRLAGCDPYVVVGRLGQGLAKEGRNAPWTLDDPTDGDLTTAERFLERYATMLRSGGVVLDVKQILQDRDAGEPF